KISALIQAKSLGKLETPLATLSGVPKQLVDIVNKAMATDKQQRYHTAEEMGKELENFIRDRSSQQAYTHLQQLVRKFWS
ncbi:hypothetical protein JW935_03655, partial [candidate division KSB1 bacterium]|nr:hypothetical protein [candidate division KSB1 bacterium]